MPKARDYTAEIDAAIDAVVDAAGPVHVTAEPSPARRVAFVTADRAAAGERWAVFAGELGDRSPSGPVLRVGLGPPDDLDVERARQAGRAAGGALRGASVGIDFPHTASLAALMDGLVTGYTGTAPLAVHVPPELLSPAECGVLGADVARLARRLVSAPANVLTPDRAARWAQHIADRAGLSCEVLGPDELSRQGFGALTAIGAGSVNGARLVRLDYRAEPTRDAVDVALVGKGITFDSGGLSLKSPVAMQSMRLDVAGAATVMAVMAGLRRAACAQNVRAVLPFAENLPGPGAARPGDVVTAWNGTQIQILDTDFEGRVVLADALALAASARPGLIVDLATLTYQAEIALGPQIAAVFGRDDAAVTRFIQAGVAAGEPMWQLPWARRYLDQVRTPSGVRNHPLHDSGRAITAALFLGEFVADDVPWVHCDMTGPAWSGDASHDGATGFGARTLLRLLTTT